MRKLLLAGLLALVLAMTEPAYAQPSPMTATARPAAKVRISTLTAAQWHAMVRSGAWHEGCPGNRWTFRRVAVNHVGFDGEVHRGAVIVNRDVAVEVGRILKELYRQRFPIKRMRPIWHYDGDDAASMRANNTSAQNCRRASEANSPAAVSPHANGRALDINPVQNPWVDPRCDCWRPTATYVSRAGQGRIRAGSPVIAAFAEHGWIWRGTGSEPDFQHFDTGYPSRPVG